MPRPAVNGVRTHIVLTRPQKAALTRLAARTGLTTAELVRRAIDQYLGSIAKEAKRA